jgi:hypothetical protein
MAKKIRVWDGSAWQDVAPALPYTAVHSAQASMPSTAVDGQIWLDTDASVPSTTVTRWYKLPSAGTTTLSGNDDNSIPLAYTPGYEQVFLNGTLLSRSAADYTATTGTSVVLSSAIVAGDIVEIICPLQITTTDTYTQSATDNKFVQNTGYFAAGKNKIINSDFSIWQRGTSFSNPTNGTYITDRWFMYFDGSGATRTISQQTFTGDNPSGCNASYYLRWAQTVAGTGGSINAMFSRAVEDVRNFNGQTVTVSFWAKADAARSIILQTYQEFGTGGSGAVFVNGSTFSATTSWTRFSATISMPSVSGKTITGNSSITFIVNFPVNTAQTIEITGLQLELGSVATAFQTATGTIQGELAACQRYYFRLNATDVYTRWAPAIGQNGTSVQAVLNYPVQMRIKPTSLDYSNLAVYDTATVTNVTSASFTDGGANSTYVQLNVASGITQYRPYQLLAANNAAAFIGLSAEL